jgi:hypothetical protein
VGEDRDASAFLRNFPESLARFRVNARGVFVPEQSLHASADSRVEMAEAFATGVAATLPTSTQRRKCLDEEDDRVDDRTGWRTSGLSPGGAGMV